MIPGSVHEVIAIKMLEAIWKYHNAIRVNCQGRVYWIKKGVVNPENIRPQRFIIVIVMAHWEGFGLF